MRFLDFYTLHCPTEVSEFKLLEQFLKFFFLGFFFFNMVTLGAKPSFMEVMRNWLLIFPNRNMVLQYWLKKRSIKDGAETSYLFTLTVMLV